VWLPNADQVQVWAVDEEDVSRHFEGIVYMCFFKVKAVSICCTD
jgi:hypothetical protein